MLDMAKITTLMLARQHLTKKANEQEYIPLYRDMQPGVNVYWNGFGDPPSLTYRADFDDIEYNRRRQLERKLIKGRFVGSTLGWIMPEDLELFACVFKKPLTRSTERQQALLELIEHEGPLTIGQMKQATGMLVKEITPALHRLQEAFLIYEDQYDGEWDRGWYIFSEMFPDVDIARYTKTEALKILLRRFAYRHVAFDTHMARSFYKLPVKELATAVDQLMSEGVLCQEDGYYLLREDRALLDTFTAKKPRFVYAMHRGDFLVKAGEHILKDKYPHTYPDTLYYLYIDGTFCGAVVGKFRYTPEVQDVILTLPQEEAAARKEEILAAIHLLCGSDNPIRHYCGVPLA